MDLATTHINADLDGLASLVALGRLEAPITLGLSGAMDPTTWRFYDAHREALPPILQPAEVAARLASEPLGRLRVADTASAGRLGVVEPYVEGFADVRCWDNHPPQDGDLPVVDMPEVGACTSALVLQMAARGIVPTATEAGLFLLGIHVDTGNFTFPTTRRSDHDAAAQCLAWGAPKSWPGRYAPKGYSVRQLVLLDRIARSVRFVDVPGTDVPLAAIELDAHEPDLAVLIEQMREAERWPAALLVVASGGGVAVIGRSDGRLDVGAVARALGGGGHTEAASAVLRGTTLGEAVALVEHTLREQWGRRRTVGEVATRRFVWAPAATTVRDAADTLHRYRINALPLTEGEGEARRFVGLVSRQELDAALRHGLTDLPAGDVSAGPPAWLPADTPLDEARAAMLDDTRRLMLVGDPAGQPVGLVTRGELFRAWEAADHVRPGPERAPGARTVLPLLRKALGERFRLAEAVGDLGAELGMAVHLVGGPVRDAMMGRPVRDLDLVVEGDAVKLARALAAARGGRVYAHEDFGTAHYVDPDGEEVDLASARVEYYERPAALPRVLNAELRRDLYRRDFTINAMAIALGPSELGRLLDPYGGLRDLHQRVLRVLHGLSFHDDPTRAFRAARFAARFDFRLAPQTATLLGAARRAGVLDALGIERLGAELDRMLGELEVVQAFRLLREWDLLSIVHERFGAGVPFLDLLAATAAAHAEARGLRGDGGGATQAEAGWLAVAAAIPAEDREARVRLIPGGRAAQRRFREGPERVAAAVGRLARAWRPSYAAGALEDLDDAERVYALAQAVGDARGWVVWWEREGRLVRSAVTGAELLAGGADSGPPVGRALRAALRAAWNGEDGAGQRSAAAAALAGGVDE